MVLHSMRFSNNQRLVDASDNNPAIYRGERGEGIRLIQQGLIDLGYAMPTTTRRYGSPDGIFGGETKAKVMKFQTDNRLGRDGAVGRNTMHKLEKLLPSTAKPLPPLPAGTKTRLVYSVPMVRQGPNPICWLACVAMILSFKERRSVTIGELNDGFDPSNSSIGVLNSSWPEFYDQLSEFGFTSERSTMSPDVSYIYDIIRWHGPFILTHYAQFPAAIPNNGGTHAVVITGIDMNADKVFYNNPWGTRNDTTSIATIQRSMERLWQRNLKSVAYLT